MHVRIPNSRRLFFFMLHPMNKMDIQLQVSKLNLFLKKTLRKYKITIIFCCYRLAWLHQWTSSNWPQKLSWIKYFWLVKSWPIKSPWIILNTKIIWCLFKSYTYIGNKVVGAALEHLLYNFAGLHLFLNSWYIMIYHE